jgi:hypothetical protein
MSNTVKALAVGVSSPAIRCVCAVFAACVCLFMASASQASPAEPSTVNTRGPIAFDAFNCLGESVPVEGMLHFVQHTVVGADGTSHSVNQVFLTGTGHDPATGNAFVVHQTSTFASNQSVDAANEFTATLQGFTHQQGSPAPNDDLAIRTVVHFTVTANGELTAEVLSSEFECK